MRRYCRVPYCFFLIGGVAAVLCLMGLILVTQSTEQTTAKTAQELPSLSPGEVVRTKLFYVIGRTTLKESVNHPLTVS